MGYEADSHSRRRGIAGDHITGVPTMTDANLFGATRSGSTSQLFAIHSLKKSLLSKLDPAKDYSYVPTHDTGRIQQERKRVANKALFICRLSSFNDREDY